MQDPAREALFLGAVHGGDARTLAEDFSGPASICRAWLAMGQDRRAIATDLDPEPLEHAKRRLIDVLGAAALERLELHQDDVLEASGAPDIIAALNFACCELHRRERLVTYLRHALFRLRQGGVLVLDTYAGANAFETGVSTVEIETEAGTLLYEWEQVEANPMTARVLNAIHFVLPDGRRIEGAFRYDWRLWGVAELRDAMREAGFARTEVYAHMGDAIADDGTLLVRPTSADGEEPAWATPTDLDESHVVFVVGRV